MTKEQAFGTKVKPSTVQVSDGSKFAGSVFLYLFLALGITAIVSTVLGFILSKTVFVEGGDTKAFAVVLLIALCLYLPIMLWVQFAALRNGKTMVPAYVTYSVVMGILISSFTALLPFWIIATAFGITCLTFGVMALIAWTAKSSLNSLAVIASGLIIGSLMMALFNVIFGLITKWGSPYQTMSWIISYVLLFAVILITIFDFRNIKEISERGGAEKNVALLCALNLYVDFIYIFIRILGLLARLFGSNR